MEAQDHLQLEKLENRRINKTLNEIKSEVERKTSVIKRQKEEYEDMQKSMNSIRLKLEQATKVSQYICVQVSPTVLSLKISLLKAESLFIK